MEFTSTILAAVNQDLIQASIFVRNINPLKDHDHVYKSDQNIKYNPDGFPNSENDLMEVTDKLIILFTLIWNLLARDLLTPNLFL